MEYKIDVEKQSGEQGEKPADQRELDHLTGTLKKSVAEALIASLLNRNRSGALLMCDVNNMKRINDQYGHLAGDECLKRVSQILAFMIRQDDIFCRSGGDEFLIFMPNCQDVQQSEEICQRIEKRFRTTGKQEKGQIPLSVTAVVVLWQPGDDCKKLLERADMELQKRKSLLRMEREKKNSGGDHYIKDASRIRKELMEQIRKPGRTVRIMRHLKGYTVFWSGGS